jgi:hypothetical protein
MENADEKDGLQNPVNIAKKIKKAVIGFLGTVSPIIISLVIEYKYFQSTTPEASPKNQQFIYAEIMALTFIGLCIFLFGLLKIIFQHLKNLRESFSLYSVITVAFFLVLSLETLIFGFMSWFIPQILYAHFKNISYTAPPLSYGDYFSLVILLILIFITLTFLHKNWSGLISIESYQNTQRVQTSSWIVEGISELSRILKRQPSSQVYRSEDSNLSYKKLNAAVDSLSWQEQAQKLVSLSSSAYYFDSDTGWHDKPGCWVGHYLNNGDELIFLKPSEKRPSKKELQDLVEHAEKICLRENKIIGEVIVAARAAITRKTQVNKTVRIRYVSENELLDSLVDFTAYFADIKKRFLYSNLPDSNLSLTDVYTPSYCTAVEGDRQPTQVEELLNSWLREPGHRQIALLGEYGQGKSTTSLAWAYHLITEPDAPRRIPILIELRGTSPRDLTDLEFLGAWAAKYNISPQALMRLIIAGRVVLIFEGFDEMALIGNTEMRLKHFNTLWAFAFDKCKILITGRPNLFLDEQEKKAALGIDKPRGNEPYCEAFHLQPFTPEQISDSLRAFDREIRETITNLARTNSRFLELVSRPSLLYIVATLWNRYRLAEKIDKLTSAYVMELFIHHSYRREGAKQNEQPGFLGLTSLEREYFMKGIATYMFANNLPNQIQNYQLNEAITKLISCIPDSVSTASTSINDETRQPLKKRISDLEHGIELIKTDVRACGLLVADPSSTGTFKFGHKSFMEYLFASVLADSFKKEGSETSSSILSTVGGDVLLLIRSRESTGFFAELLSEQVSVDLAKTGKKGVTIATLLFHKMIEGFYLKRAVFRIWSFLIYKSRRKMYGLSPLLLVIASTSPMIVGGSSIAGRYFNSDLALFGSIPITVCWVLMFLGFITYSITFNFFTQHRRFEIWLQICKEAKISDEDIKASLGISKTSMLKNLSLIDENTETS